MCKTLKYLKLCYNDATHCATVEKMPIDYCHRSSTMFSDFVDYLVEELKLCHFGVIGYLKAIGYKLQCFCELKYINI